jgi:hypothetical protein
MRTKTTKLTRAERTRWAGLARTYAQVRWCWDDCEDDIQTRADMNNERPDDFIDRMAEKWGLDDPSAPWAHPGYVPEDVEHTRAMISKRFPQLGGKR